MTEPITHPSFNWTTYHRSPNPERPLEPDRYRRLMQVEALPRASAYDPAWIHWNAMGPFAVWLSESLSQVVSLPRGARVLDLGCGSAVSSIFLARELDLQVWATDLWVNATSNLARIEEAGIGHRVFPIHAEAHALPFAEGFFDAIVSVDSFHYFGTDALYLSYISAFLRPGGILAMVAPGNGAEIEDVPEDYRRDPSVARHIPALFTFRSPAWWRRHWERTGEVEVLHADMVPDGWALWHRFLEASEAWSGTPVADQVDGALILPPAGRTLGFTRVVARRRGAL